MSAPSFMKVFEALRDVAEDTGTSDEFTCAVFDLRGMLVFYGMSDETKAHVDKSVRMIRDILDGVPMRMIREDKLN